MKRISIEVKDLLRAGILCEMVNVAEYPNQQSPDVSIAAIFNHPLTGDEFTVENNIISTSLLVTTVDDDPESKDLRDVLKSLGVDWKEIND